MADRPSITLIAGPTASGKSRLALETAQATGAVILNADSQQLYADLNVLSARPSAEDEASAEHRLYGVADAAEAWSVGRWTRAVRPELEALEAEGRPALLVGGTGLYFLSLTRGLADIPQVTPEVRNSVEGRYDVDGEAEFRRALAEVDPNAEAAIEAGDRQRLVRALSVYEQTGKALSAFKADTRPLIEPERWTGLVVEPARDRLYLACDRRVDVMIETGAVEEVRALLARNLDPALPAMKAVGVRELGTHLAGEITLDEAAAAMKQATRNYAKRQLTWYRNQTPDWPRHPGFA